MREILFKAKRLDNGKWVEGYYIYHIKRTPCVIGDWVKPEDEQHVIMRDGFSDWNMPRDTVYYDIDPSTLCEFTGLRDKNGKRIWEGDIITFGHGITWAIGFQLNAFVAMNEQGEVQFALFEQYGCDYHEHKAVAPNYIEVIGNIYDNPELI